MSVRVILQSDNAVKLYREQFINESISIQILFPFRSIKFTRCDKNTKNDTRRTKKIRKYNI